MYWHGWTLGDEHRFSSCLGVQNSTRFLFHVHIMPLILSAAKVQNGNLEDSLYRLIRFSLHPLGNSSDNHTRIEPRINCRPERLHPNQPWPLSRRDSQWRPPLLYLAHCTGSQPHLLLPRGPRAVQWWDENPVMINRSTPMKDPRTVGPRPPPPTTSS